MHMHPQHVFQTVTWDSNSQPCETQLSSHGAGTGLANFKFLIKIILKPKSFLLLLKFRMMP